MEDDEPYSDQAAEIGYESTFIVPNSGTLLLFAAIFAVLLAISLLITKLVKSGKIHNFVRKKREMFFWGGLIDYLNESFIVLSISVCINSSHLTFDTFSIGFNIILAALIGLLLLIGPIIIANSFSKALK